MSASPSAFPMDDRRAALLVMQWLEAVQRSDVGAAHLDALGAATAAISQAFNVDPDRDGLDLNPEFHSLRKLLRAQSGATPGTSDTDSDTTPAVGVDSLGTAASSGGGGGGGKSSKPKRLRAVQSAPAKFPAIGVGGDLSGRHILLVDDVKSVLKLGTRRLEKAGALVTTAGDGHEAVAEVAKAIERGQPFDMVLMDLHMPKMDGIEATRQIRANHGAHAPLVIGLTADELVQATTSEVPRTPPRLSRKVQRKRFAAGVALADSAPPERATSKARLFTQSGARGVISKPYTIAQILDLAR